MGEKIKKLFKGKSKAISLLEYALMLSVVYLAISGMQLYLKRGIQARVKDLTTNLMVKDLYPSGEHQFVAGYSRSDYNVATDSIVDITALPAGSTGAMTEVTVSAVEGTDRRGMESSVTEGWEDCFDKDC